MHKSPLPHNRKPLDIENHEAIGLQFHLKRHAGDKGNAQPGSDSEERLRLLASITTTDGG